LVLQQRFDEGYRLFFDQHDQAFDPAAWNMESMTPKVAPKYRATH